MATTIERQTAYLTTIGTLLHGNFIKGEAHMQPHFLRTASGKELNRIHIIAVLVGFGDSTGSEATIDDGTGKITARSFDHPTLFSNYHLGDIVRIIGKVRAFNEQQYLIPEIVKKITNKQFITLHKQMLRFIEKYEKDSPLLQNVSVTEISSVIEESITDSSLDQIPVDADDTAPPSPFDEIILRIKQLDTGDGAAIEQIIEQTSPESERLIQNLLETGNIFEIRPGRIKLLD